MTLPRTSGLLVAGVTPAQLDDAIADLNGTYLAGAVIAAGTVGAGGVASIDLTAIPATYRNLELEFFGRGEDAGANVGLRVSVNGDSGTSYHSERLSATDSTASAGPTTGASFWTVGSNALVAGGASANRGTAMRLWFPNYASTTFHKIAQGQVSKFDADATAAFHTSQFGGLWKSDVAITSLRIFTSAGDIAEGSMYRLVGIGSPA
jgi:hypothetical protein